jgi:hypothetical protein
VTKNSLRSKATKALSRVELFFREAEIFVGEYRIRKEAKKDAKRARRRLSKAILKEDKDDIG